MSHGGERFQIIIAGAGIAGAAMALFLSHLDAHLTIFDSRPCRPNAAEGGIIMLGPNGMNVLQGLGLSSKLLQRETGIQVSHITIKDGSGDLIGQAPQGSVERHGSASTALLRWDIHEVLLDALEEKRIDIRWNSRVESMEELDNGVLVRWSEAGEMKQKKADLLIGADGIWSTTRPSMYECLGLAVPKPRYSGLVGIGFILDTDSIPGLATFLTLEQPIVMVHDRLGFVGIMLYDKKGKKVGWWTTHEASERSREEWKVPREQIFHELRERYSTCAFPIPQLIQVSEASGEQPLIWPVYEVEKLGHWHSRCTVLIGDAAHAMPPHSGQGASQALEDAAYLAHLLRQYFCQLPDSATADLHSVLDTFQKERQPRVDEIVDEANRRGDMKRETSRVGMFVRKWVMRVIFFFMTQRWMDRWFGYKVPGIQDWATLEQRE
ncbi:FAD/NAD(P)-binding domain-containing protein [Pisolithus marmoratus]|nr:FAD/NAD(P)-binding domain-containing protein [Pisolithus marmoratus]